MPFEIFTPPRKRADKPIVSITKNRLQLNKKCQKYFEGVNFVELYYDRKNKIIGIKPQRKGTNKALKINRYDDRGIAVIAATQFLRIYGIAPMLKFDVFDNEGRRKGGQSIQIIAEWDDKENMVIVKLK